MIMYELPNYCLKPGEIRFTVAPARIITILGSCISIIMHSENSGAGAMCNVEMPYDHMEKAIEWMTSRFDRIGIGPEKIRVRIYGGLDIYLNSLSACRENMEAAVRFIERKRMMIREWKTGGSMNRKIVFNTATGDVSMKCTRRIQPKTRSSSQEGTRSA